LYLSDIKYFIVIPAQAGIQKNGKIRLFTKPSRLNIEYLWISVYLIPEAFIGEIKNDRIPQLFNLQSAICIF